MRGGRGGEKEEIGRKTSFKINLVKKIKKKKHKKNKNL